MESKTKGLSKISYQAYCQIDALNQSRLKKILISQRLFELDPIRISPALDTGHIVHEFLEKKSLSHFVVMPDFNRRTKAGKEAEAAFKEENKDKIVCDSQQFELLRHVAKSFNEHKQARKLLHSSDPELTATAPLYGHYAKGRFDLLQRYIHLITDVKTTRRVTKGEFERDAISFGYPFQAAFYRMLYQAIFGELPTFAFLVIQTCPPFELALYFPDEDFIEYGNKQVAKAFEIYNDCLAKGFLPAQSDGKGEVLSLPPYIKVIK